MALPTAKKEKRRLSKATGTEPRQPKGERVRRCIVTGDHLSPAQMVRFAVSPDDTIVPDIRAKLPGRGCWVTADRAQVNKAVATKAFARAAKQSVQVDDGLADLVENLLSRQVLNMLGLARKGGQIEQGFAKVETALKGDQPVALFEARDGAEDGRRRLMALATKSERVMVVGCFTSEELSLAIGRENVVHAALKDGGVSARILEECNRLQGFRPLIPGEWRETPMAIRDSAG